MDPILEALNEKFSGPKYEADSDTTSVDGVYKVTFYHRGTHSVLDSMYVKARMTDSGLATEPAPGAGE